MAWPKRNVAAPHPNQLLIGQLHAQVAAERGQPSGNIASMGKGTPQDVQAGMGSLYDFARARGGENDQGYLVDAWHGLSRQGPIIGPARIAKTTLDDELERLYYGPAYDEIRAAATGNTPPPSVRHPFGNLDGQLRAPLYLVTHPEGAPAKSGADIRGVVELSPHEAARSGVSLDYIKGHELGHEVSPMPGSSRQYGTRIPMFADQVRRDYPALIGKPGILKSMAHRLAYLSMPAERAAIGNQFRRAEYGVTGNKMTTEGDIIRALRGVLDGPPMPIAKPSAKVETMFPGDPIMQHGPRAGQPAEGYNNMRQQLRQLLPGLTPQHKRELIDIFKSGASTSNPNEVMYG